MLLDQYMPEFDFREVHQTRIDPHPAALYDLVRHLDFSDSAITRVLFRLRGLATTRMDLDRILQRGEFRLLDEQAGREFVLGGIGSRFLRLVRFESARDFQEHRAPGAIKVTWNFTVTENADGGATVRTETRVQCLGRMTKILFGLYWLFVRPFSGLIRLEMLRLVRRQARLALTPAEV